METLIVWTIIGTTAVAVVAIVIAIAAMVIADLPLEVGNDD